MRCQWPLCFKMFVVCDCTWNNLYLIRLPVWAPFSTTLTLALLVVIVGNSCSAISKPDYVAYVKM
jgi:hypothetical protein